MEKKHFKVSGYSVLDIGMFLFLLNGINWMGFGDVEFRFGVSS